MYNTSLALVGICMLIIPILLIVFICQWIRKKSKRRIGYALISCIVCFVVFVFVGLFNVPPEKQKEKESIVVERKETPFLEEQAKPTFNITPAPTPTPTPEVDSMKTQFKELGFADAEAEEMEKIFATVGITEISNIQPAIGNGIDNLQSFKCDIYDYHADKGGISVHFTIDKRQLCFISLDGIPTTKTDYAYINIFGNVKFKTSNGTQSVTLYDKWDESGEIDNNAVGYIAVFDYNNKKITKYEK